MMIFKFLKYRVITAIILLLIVTQNSFAQYAKAVAKIDTTTMLIGDQIKMNLTFTVPANAKIYYPQITDTLTKAFEIVNKSKVDSIFSTDKKNLELKQTLVLTAFDSGFYVIPPIRLNFKLDKDTVTHFVETEATLIEVKTLKIDTTLAIKDIKKPLSIPLTFKEILPWFAGGLILVAIIVGTIYYFKRRKSGKVFEFKKPKIPAHVIAFDELEKLKNEKLWQSNYIKEYHSKLSDIIRTYIENRFMIPAMEMITDDIIFSMKSQNLHDDLIVKLTRLLFIADLVKFAKEQPLPTEHEESFNNAYEFVKSTIYVQPEAVENIANVEKTNN